MLRLEFADLTVFNRFHTSFSAENFLSDYCETIKTLNKTTWKKLHFKAKVDFKDFRQFTRQQYGNSFRSISDQHKKISIRQNSFFVWTRLSYYHPAEKDKDYLKQHPENSSELRKGEEIPS